MIALNERLLPGNADCPAERPGLGRFATHPLRVRRVISVMPDLFRHPPRRVSCPASLLPRRVQPGGPRNRSAGDVGGLPLSGAAGAVLRPARLITSRLALSTVGFR